MAGWEWQGRNGIHIQGDTGGNVMGDFLILETNVYPAFHYTGAKSAGRSKNMNKTKFYLSVIAAFTLAIFSFSGCDTAVTGASSEPAPGLSVSKSVGNAGPDLTGNTYICDIGVGGKYGMSRIDFISSTDATGVLGDTDHTFKYVITAVGVGILSEPSTGYGWNISVGSNFIHFTGGFDPYTGDPVIFDQITIQPNADLSDLDGTNWLGRGPRGESTLTNVTSTSGTTDYSLTGTFGPDQPNPFTITGYTYSGGIVGTGKGTMNGGAGAFTSAGSTATLTFPDFWGHDVQVVFNKFVYN
jgi:hypothetical protein